MKYLTAGLIMLVSGQTMAGSTSIQAYPSCDLLAQRSVKTETGGNIKDPLEAYISVRVSVLQADISTARKTRQLTQAQADSLWQHTSRVRNDARRFVEQQGFLSAAERASYDRELDELASKFCVNVEPQS